MVNTVIYKFLDRYPYYWLGFCLIFLVFGLGLMTMGAVIQSENRTVTVTQQENEFVVSSVEYSAVAQNNTSAYSKGRKLVGSPLYTLDEYPVLNASYQTTFEQRANATTRVVVEYLGVQQGFEFWNETEVIHENSYTVNGSYNGSAEINMSAVTQRAFSIRKSFDSQGQVQVRIRVVTEYETKDYSGSTVIESDLLFTDSTYSVIPPKDLVETSESVQVVTQVPDDKHRFFFYSGGVLLLISGVFFVAHRLADPRRVMNDYVLMRHDDWITEVENVEYRQEYDCTVNVDGAVDLIDVAADTGGRIMWEAKNERYQVVNEGMIYTYELKKEDKLTVRGTEPGEFGRPGSSSQPDGDEKQS